MQKKGAAWVGHLRSRFLMGLLVGIPVLMTIWILLWLFNTIDNILQPIFTAILGSHIPGVGFVATVLLIYLMGVIASNVVGKRLILYAESKLARVPVVWQLYTGIKQVLESFSLPSKAGFLRVVLVHWPRQGILSLAFVTNEVQSANGEKLYHVFIPNSPIPNSGFFQILKEAEVIPTHMTVNEALKLIVSAGKVTPGNGAEFGA